MELNSEALKVSPIVLHSHRGLAKKVLSPRTDSPSFWEHHLEQESTGRSTLPNNARYLVGGINFGFLDSYSGNTNEPQGSVEVQKVRADLPPPLLQPGPPPFTPLCLLLCWVSRRRRCGGRWVSGWGKGCGAKSCLIATLHGLDHFSQRLCLSDLLARAVCPSMTEGT